MHMSRSLRLKYLFIACAALLYACSVQVFGKKDSHDHGHDHDLNPDWHPQYAYVDQTHYYLNNDLSKLHVSAVNPCDQLYLSQLFTDDMILQRSPSQSVIFGFGTPNATVQVTVYNGDNSFHQSFITSINDANSKANDYSLGLSECTWSVVLPPINASNGLTVNNDGSSYYTIEVSCINSSCTNWNSSNVISVTNIQFGDIWVCTGQSNMWLGVEHTYSWYNTSINQTCDNYNIKVFKLPQVMSLTPLDSKKWIGNNGLKWENASYNNLTKLEFSAVCYYFARNLIDFWTQNNDIDSIVPIGLVDR